MAISRRFQAKTTVTAALHSHLLLNKETLLKQKVEILSHSANADGTVTVVFCGQGLGVNAVPIPPPCTVTVNNGQIAIQPIE